MADRTWDVDLFTSSSLGWFQSSLSAAQSTGISRSSESRRNFEALPIGKSPLKLQEAAWTPPEVLRCTSLYEVKNQPAPECPQQRAVSVPSNQDQQGGSMPECCPLSVADGLFVNITCPLQRLLQPNISCPFTRQPPGRHQQSIPAKLLTCPISKIPSYMTAFRKTSHDTMESPGKPEIPTSADRVQLYCKLWEKYLLPSLVGNMLTFWKKRLLVMNQIHLNVAEGIGSMFWQFTCNFMS